MPLRSVSAARLLIYCLGAGSLYIAWVYAFYSGKLLSADGAHYLMTIADTGDYMLVRWHRHHAQFVTQWPVVFARRYLDLGVGSLATIYALSILSFTAVSLFFTCRWFRPRPELALFPFLSFAVSELHADYIIMGEHHVLALAAWPILAFALFPRESRFDRIAFLGFALISIRSYETAAAALALPVAICAIRAARSKRGADIAFWLAGAGILLLGPVFSLDGIIASMADASAGGFLQAALIPFESSFIVAACVVLAGYVAALAAGRAGIAAAACIAGVLLLARAYLAGEAVTASQSFATRTVTLTILPAAMLACALLRLQAWRESHRRAALVGAAFCCVLALYSIGQQKNWSRALAALEAQLSARAGFIPYAELEADPAQFAPSPWALPTLSILLQPDCARSLVLMPENYPWQPFDPRERLPLPASQPYAQALDGSGCGL